MSLRRRGQASVIDAPLTSLADSTSAEIANVLSHNVEIIVQGFSALQQLLITGVAAAVRLSFALWVSPPLMLAASLLAALGLQASRAYGREQSLVSRQYVADMTLLAQRGFPAAPAPCPFVQEGGCGESQLRRYFFPAAPRLPASAGAGGLRVVPANTQSHIASSPLARSSTRLSGRLFGVTSKSGARGPRGLSERAMHPATTMKRAAAIICC